MFLSSSPYIYFVSSPLSFRILVASRCIRLGESMHLFNLPLGRQNRGCLISILISPAFVLRYREHDSTLLLLLIKTPGNNCKHDSCLYWQTTLLHFHVWKYLYHKYDALWNSIVIFPKKRLTAYFLFQSLKEFSRFIATIRASPIISFHSP